MRRTLQEIQLIIDTLMLSLYIQSKLIRSVFVALPLSYPHIVSWLREEIYFNVAASLSTKLRYIMKHTWWRSLKKNAYMFDDIDGKLYISVSRYLCLSAFCVQGDCLFPGGQHAPMPRVGGMLIVRHHSTTRCWLIVGRLLTASTSRGPLKLDRTIIRWTLIFRLAGLL